MAWEEIEIQEVCRVVNGSTPSRKCPEFFNGEINWFTPKDLSRLQTKYIFESPEKISNDGYNSCSTTLIPKLSLLLTSRAPIGHLAINQIECCTNQGFKNLVPNVERIDINFLYYLIKSQIPQIKHLGRGATFKELSKKDIEKFKIPLPPLPIQKKIAAILDAADNYRQKTKALIDKYDQLTQSIFLDMFGDPVRNEKGWEVCIFKELAEFDTNMISDFSDYQNYPHIGIGNIEKETGRLFGYKTIQEDNVISGKYLFTNEHIIYSKIRPNLNKVALPNFSGLCSADAYPLKPIQNKTNRIFLSFILRSKSFLDFILGHSTRTNIPKANKNQMSKYKGICPPIELQNAFVLKIKKVEKQKTELTESIVKSENLFQSLLQKAFKGELVFNGS